MSVNHAQWGELNLMMVPMSYHLYYYTIFQILIGSNVNNKPTDVGIENNVATSRSINNHIEKSCEYIYNYVQTCESVTSFT